MILNLSKSQQEKLLKYLNEDADAEQLSVNEFVADFYDAEPPVTVNFLLTDNGEIEIAAAALLLYDEEQDGWYMGDRIEDESAILAALTASEAI